MRSCGHSARSHQGQLQQTQLSLSLLPSSRSHLAKGRRQQSPAPLSRRDAFTSRSIAFGAPLRGHPMLPGQTSYATKSQLAQSTRPSWASATQRQQNAMGGMACRSVSDLRQVACASNTAHAVIASSSDDYGMAPDNAFAAASTTGNCFKYADSVYADDVATLSAEQQGKMSLWLCIHQPAGPSGPATAYPSNRPMTDTLWHNVPKDERPAAAAQVAAGITFSNCAVKRGSWHNYPVIIADGVLGSTSSDTFWPNLVLTNHKRQTHNIGTFQDLVMWVADPRREGVQQHLENYLAKSVQEGWDDAAKKCWSRLRRCYGRAGLAVCGITIGTIEMALAVIKHKADMHSAGHLRVSALCQ